MRLLAEAYSINRKGLDRKAEWIKAAYVLLVVSASTVGLPVILRATRALIEGRCYGL